MPFLTSSPPLFLSFLVSNQQSHLFSSLFLFFPFPFHMKAGIYSTLTKTRWSILFPWQHDRQKQLRSDNAFPPRSRKNSFREGKSRYYKIYLSLGFYPCVAHFMFSQYFFWSKSFAGMFAFLDKWICVSTHLSVCEPLCLYLEISWCA